MIAVVAIVSVTVLIPSDRSDRRNGRDQLLKWYDDRNGISSVGSEHSVMVDGKSDDPPAYNDSVTPKSTNKRKLVESIRSISLNEIENKSKRVETEEFIYRKIL